MKCKALEPPLSKDEDIEIVYIEFDIETLIVTVLIDGDKIDISFDSPAGYRVLDEGDLLEFWPNCSSSNGWFYEIHSGGWLDQERDREGFASAAKTGSKEYFIIGCNYCINVLAWEAPSVCQSIR
ncbi:hypothetical protein SAMN03080615_02086 [Amphritea atlantica]|uniref:Uncharacterized protein n=1 Tax=Amphritea atlantica TaxID=355243 RepID=A0A1H9HDG1_9GAMM|nr:hypothetical protein [Amphritea atlantica]SEQ60403.1 hypothetical protein SAMN03080615_02086 [Amphritea atlantica]